MGFRIKIIARRVCDDDQYHSSHNLLRKKFGTTENTFFSASDGVHFIVNLSEFLPEFMNTNNRHHRVCSADYCSSSCSSLDNNYHEGLTQFQFELRNEDLHSAIHEPITIIKDSDYDYKIVMDNLRKAKIISQKNTSHKESYSCNIQMRPIYGTE